jgi:hypothetical protein
MRPPYIIEARLHWKRPPRDPYMRITSLVFFCLIVTVAAATGLAQSPSKSTRTTTGPDDLRAVKSSPGYAEVLLRKTELEAEVESLRVDHTDEFPRIREARTELEILRSEMDRLLGIKAADAEKLSAALGRLILAKIVHQAKLRQLRDQFSDDHPMVRRQRRTVEIYEAAIKEILG